MYKPFLILLLPISLLLSSWHDAGIATGVEVMTGWCEASSEKCQHLPISDPWSAMHNERKYIRPWMNSEYCRLTTLLLANNSSIAILLWLLIYQTGILCDRSVICFTWDPPATSAMTEKNSSSISISCSFSDRRLVMLKSALAHCPDAALTSSFSLYSLPMVIFSIYYRLVWTWELRHHHDSLWD